MFNFFSSVFLISLSGSVMAAKLPVFNPSDQPKAPDYSDSRCWSALPFRTDAADVIPRGEYWISDSVKNVDVFYIYPTIYQRGNTWNADVYDEKLNKRIDKLPIKYQASAFNHVGRVFAPRYRQAIIAAYSDKTGSGQSALDFAYEDVKSAFIYYMKHHNNGRPVIIASHSQGTTHSRRLIKDFFDTPESVKKLVCAYIIGFAIFPDDYSVLKPCDEPQKTECYVTWASFKNGYRYTKDLPYYGKTCVNPVSWKIDSLSAIGKGGVLLGFNKRRPYKTEAIVKENYLWVKTNMPFVQTWNNKHLVDYNLFWYDIRKNAEARVNAYLEHK